MTVPLRKVEGDLPQFFLSAVGLETTAITGSGGKASCVDFNGEIMLGNRIGPAKGGWAKYEFCT